MATAKRTSARTHGDGSKGSARTERHLHSRPRVLAYAVGTALLPWTLITPAFADVAPSTLPTGGNVVAGSASISSSGANMQITQGTNAAILNWQSFSIGSGASVNFSQPSSSAVALNRVLGNNPSEIFGRLTADGQVFLTNPNGVLFAKSASVDVGGLFATTLAIADRDFLAGRYNFVNNGGAGSVVNQGVITATNYAALAAPQVRNEGIIVAHAGTVALAAGDRVSLDMVGDGLIRVSVAEAALNASALNSGTLQADGGNVILTARSANALLDTIINNSGIIRANSLVARNGEIVLDGGSTGVVANSGTLEAVGADAGTTGGTVKVLGQYVGLFDGSKIDASGDAGGGTVLVGGSFHGAGPEQNASHTYVAGGASINADAIRTGNGGNVAVWSNDGTKFYGTTSARGGRDSGDGGFVEVSGQHSLVYAGRVDTRAPNGKAGMLLLDPDDATIDNTTDSNDTSAAGVFTSLDGNAFTVTWDTINTTLATTPTTIQTSTGSITVADSSLNSTAGELVGNGNLLHLDSATTININASIIANTTVSPLQFTAPGGINLGANLKSNGGNITFDNATLLTAGVTVDSGGGTILFSNTLDGTFSLGLTAGAGDISFVGAVGGGSPLGAVTINSAHDVTAAAFSGASLVQTTGSGATTLNRLVTANAAGGIDITNTAIAANGGISAPAAGASVNLHATASALSVGANSLAANTNVTLTADGGTGDISTAAGGTVTATSGAVQMTAGRSVTLNDVVTAGTTVGISFGQTTAGVFTANSTFSAGTSTTITGGANADTFNINTSITADLKGGAGSDVFALGGNTLSGTIDGEGNGGSITGITGGATLTAVGATAGFNGTTPLVTGNFSNITDLQGSGTLQGLDAVSSWSLAGTSGTYTSTNSLNFSGFGTLQGGTQADTFTLTNNAAFTLRGGDALDVFALASHTLTGSIDGEAAGGSITVLVDASITVPGGTIGYNGTSAQVSANYSNITDLQGTGTLAGTNNTSSWSGLTPPAASTATTVERIARRSAALPTSRVGVQSIRSR